MAVPLAEGILQVFKEGLSAWKTFIATRQEAYNRKKDKHQERAINIAEQSYEKVSELFEFLATLPMEEKATTELSKHKTVIYKLKRKFNKYD